MLVACQLLQSFLPDGSHVMLHSLVSDRVHMLLHRLISQDVQQVVCHAGIAAAGCCLGWLLLLRSCCLLLLCCLAGSRNRGCAVSAELGRGHLAQGGPALRCLPHACQQGSASHRHLAGSARIASSKLHVIAGPACSQSLSALLTDCHLKQVHLKDIPRQICNALDSSKPSHCKRQYALLSVPTSCR